MMWMFEDGMSALAKENSLHARDKTPYTEEELLASAAPPSATS
jgi:hypothetical protein